MREGRLRLDPRGYSHHDMRPLGRGADMAHERPNLFGRAHNLPAQVSSFVGRETALAELRRLLISARLVTLTGTGGIGKTRLGLALADLVLPDYPDGVWLVDLAPVNDPGLVTPTVASVFGLRLSGTAPRDELSEILRQVQILLVLDNCERLVEACAELADALLRACPELQIVATSREALNVPGEVVWPVAGLAVPDADAALFGHSLTTEAVRLFEQRAQSVAPAFKLTDVNTPAVADICRQLDGIPLAIELAAARSKVLAPQQLADRLGDRFQLLIDGARTVSARHQTLRATIDWSYNLLPESERSLFERLSLFTGGCTLEAVQAVCADGPEVHDSIVHVLERLVDRSLLVAHQTQDGWMRYQLLETLRQYGLEQLNAHGMFAATSARHAEFFAELADAAELVFVSPRQPEADKILADEYDNLRTALNGLIETGSLPTARRIAGAMWHFWENRRSLSEGSVWVADLLAATGTDEACARIRLLHGAGMIASWTHHAEAGERYGEESLALARELGDLTSVSCSLHQLGSIAHTRGQNTRAEALLREGAETGALAENAGAAAEQIYPHGFARYFRFRNCITMGRVGYQTANFPLGDTAYESARALAAEVDWPLSIALALRGLGLGKLRRHDLAGARSLLEQSYALYGSAERNPEASWTRMTLGCIATDQGDRAGAAEMLTESLSRAFSGGGGLGPTEANLDACAALAASSRQPVLAARLAGAAAAIRECLPTVRYQQPIIVPLSRTNWLDVAREALHDTAFTTHMAAGRALAPAAAVAEAMAFLQPGSQTTGNTLTHRELEVARLIGRGRSNREIADELVIAVPTAERHVANILGKLGLSSRTKLAAWIHEHAGQ
jgi:predicted ATPase/DNA-binding CsgD family transcriptional regulator